MKPHPVHRLRVIFRVGRFTRRGLTAVELGAVIVIIAIALAILIPAVKRLIQRTSALTCSQQLRTIYRACDSYQLEYGDWLPDMATLDSEWSLQSPPSTWFTHLPPQYVADLSMLICPADPARPLIDLDLPLDQRPDPHNASSYGMNSLLPILGLTNFRSAPSERPAETILLADMGPDHALALVQTIDGLGRSHGWLPWDDRFIPAEAGLTHSWLTDRHFGHINVQSMDGAVHLVRTSEMKIERIRSYYGDCAAGKCPLCKPLSVPHYSFASDRLFWWTGELPVGNP